MQSVIRMLLWSVTIALLPVGRAMAQCELLVEGNRIEGAATYECAAVSIERCSTCAIYFNYEIGRRSVATGVTPSLVIESSPTFQGWFVMMARAADGSVLSEQQLEPAESLHAAYGRPFILASSPHVAVCAGEQARLFVRFDSATPSVVQWFRNGTAILGATATEFYADAPSANATDVYSCQITNACGVSTINPIQLVSSGVTTDGSVDWRWVEESVEILSAPIVQGIACFGIRSARTVIEGGCNAAWLAADPDGFDLSMSNAIPLPSGAVELWHRVSSRFVLPSETRIDFSGVGTAHFYCGTNSPAYTLGEARLVGPVDLNFLQPVTIGRGTAVLPAGEYQLVASMHRRTSEGNRRLGRCGFGPCSCGPSCFDSCSCQVFDNCSFSLAATFIPIPACAADLNGDSMVDSSDMPGLLNAWGTTESGPADIDRDGFVGPGDLARLLASWGPCE